MVRFAIDRGGTFTDIYAVHGDRVYIRKLLSENPGRYDDAPRKGIASILSEITGDDIDPDSIDMGMIEWIRMGTTIATNALLERKGAVTALVATEGFGDILDISYQNRPELFALDIRKPSPLHSATLEISERVIPDGDEMEVLKSPDESEVREGLKRLYERGVESLAIVLAHSYGFDAHEKMVERIAEEIGFGHITVSGEAIPVLRYIDRAWSAVVDAFLTPHIRRYISGFQSGFTREPDSGSLLFMQSGGGLIPSDGFRGSNSILSGPAGGVVGYATAFYDGTPLIGFDMGGTSTDVSRFDGRYDIAYESSIDGVRIKSPHLAIETVAAGGGSKLAYRNGLYTVGPESVGADPGPVCYRKGGELSVTDANLLLGRIVPEYFPAIFGESGDMPLDREAVLSSFEELRREIVADIGSETVPGPTVEEIAMGFIHVANETMMKPIRDISASKGFETAEHHLACFGGAGGQHACAIARILGIERIYIHRHSGILSAIGIGAARLESERQKTVDISLETAISLSEDIFSSLEEEALEALGDAEFESIDYERLMRLRYDGSDTAITVTEPEDGEWADSFETEHRVRFGFVPETRDIVCESVIVRAGASVGGLEREKIAVSGGETVEEKRVRCYFDGGWLSTPLYRLDSLRYGDSMAGPALIVGGTSTIVIEPGWRASTGEYGDIVIDRIDSISSRGEESAVAGYDPVELSIFNSLFSSIASEMGETLRKTAISTNIRERLDFSCALFDERGSLVANAPHVPVHLGSMQSCVESIVKKFAGKISEGDVVLTNAPWEGGSHLPDITAVTALFDADGEIYGWLASRGHHADIGGSVPGSMNPLAGSIDEEGAVLESLIVVERGRFVSDRLVSILQEAGARRIGDNISDIKAQIASLERGRRLMRRLSLQKGIDSVRLYMEEIQRTTEEVLRKRILSLPERSFSAVEYLDDGSKLRVKIEISDDGTMRFDFDGTSIQQYGSQNVPPAVGKSAISYVMRLFIGEDIPLNGGLLGPLEILFPEGSILSPSRRAATGGGNVTTSQRLVDLLLPLFVKSAHSGGCMNNLLFGNDRFGYYETIGSGSGAGDGFDGADAVQVHMTNTRITDMEIMERRYPVIVRRYAIRRGSGGEGRYRGGDGIVREIEFRERVKLSVLTDRRVHSPAGMAGGRDGKRGVNMIERDGESYRLPSKASLYLEAGDSVRMETPGGGGYGIVDSSSAESTKGDDG